MDDDEHVQEIARLLRESVDDFGEVLLQPSLHRSQQAIAYDIATNLFLAGLRLSEKPCR